MMNFDYLYEIMSFLEIRLETFVDFRSSQNYAVRIKTLKQSYIYDVHIKGSVGGGDGGVEILKFVMCLQIPLFFKKRSTVHFFGCGGHKIGHLVWMS